MNEIQPATIVLRHRIFRSRSRRKPRVLLLADVPRWAFDHVARQMVRTLSDEFRLDIKYVRKRPRVRAKKYDLLYVFFWGEQRYKRWSLPPERIVKEVSSHRWQDDLEYGPCTPRQMVRQFLRDAHVVTCTSERMKKLLDGEHPRVSLTPNGVDPQQFRPLGKRTGPLRIGWCGNANSELKGLQSILEPACAGRFELIVAPGNVSFARMNEFYNSVDVFAVASRHEGQPITLMEAMAAGCFPVCNDVGIVPELVRSGENGIIVSERTPEAYRNAFDWCEQHLDEVRRMGAENARSVGRSRNWDQVAENFRHVFRSVLATARTPKFRNDDVSWDTDLDCFRRFCELFHRHGQTQLHGVTLYGRTNSVFRYGGESAEYENLPTIGKLPNDQIRTLSSGLAIEERRDLVEYLNSIPDEIALHGLYHTDYSTMPPDEQRREIGEGLEKLDRLFPKKLVRYFIAPFNRVGRLTRSICREFNLHLLADESVHLESVLPSLAFEENRWYRYHHHRFYPQSSFTYYPLNSDMLDTALERSEVHCVESESVKEMTDTSVRRAG